MKVFQLKPAIGNFVFRCPGCNSDHIINTEERNSNNAIWSFNGNIDKPTFAPSINCHATKEGKRFWVCHFFIRNGIIEFCSDCTHDKKGQNIPLPDLSKEFIEYWSEMNQNTLLDS